MTASLAPIARAALLATLLTAVSAGMAAPALAASSDGAGGVERLRWSGFGTLGLAWHDNDDLGVIQSFSQRRPARDGLSARLDSVLGLQADLRLFDATSATVQGVVRAGDDFRPKLRMAYLRQGFGPDLALRVGRFRSPIFFDSDVSEIGFANLMVRPNLPVYALIANNSPVVDGADLQWRQQLGTAALLVQGYVGRADYEQYFYNTTPRDRAEGDLKRIRGVAVSVSVPRLMVRASHTRVGQFVLRSGRLGQLDAGLAQVAAGLGQMAMNPMLPAPLQASLAGQAAAVQGYRTPFDGSATYSSLGFDANLGQWRLMGEWAVFDSRSAMIGRYRAWTATAGYAIREFTPYLTVSRNDRRGGSFEARALTPTGLSPELDAGIAALRAGFDDTARFANLASRSIGVGVRWEARANLAVKLQFERLKTPSGNHPGVFAVPALPIEPTTNLLSMTLDFVF